MTRARHYIAGDNLIKFGVAEKDTELLILAETNLHSRALASLIKYQSQLDSYLKKDPGFASAAKSFLWLKWGAPKIAAEMNSASKKAKVAPMAAVAGAIAEYVGKDLLNARLTKEIIVENGLDIFMKTDRVRKIEITEKIALEIEPKDSPLGICTAGAVIVLAKSTALAGAAAIAINSVVKSTESIDTGLKLAKKIWGLLGVLIVKDDKMGIVGKVRLVPV